MEHTRGVMEKRGRLPHTYRHITKGSKTVRSPWREQWGEVT